MNKEEFLNIFRCSVAAITESRFFNTERGYQGQLVAELNKNLNGNFSWPDNPIIEQEYQKKVKVHGATIRPDIIVHVPFERGTYQSRQDGNHVVIALKRDTSLDDAIKDFGDLDFMLGTLNYQLGIFLNIDADNNFFDKYTGEFANRLHWFAVELIQNSLSIIESP